MKNKIISLLFMFCILTCLGGCTKFDATEYTKACLDANIRGEFQAYTEITGVSQKELENQYNQMLEADISYLENYDPDEETKEKFRTLYIDIYQHFQYEVGPATATDHKSYSVPVTVKKIYIFKDISKNAEDYIEKYVQQQINAGKTPTTEELYKVIIDYFYDFISKNLESAQYAEPSTIQISIALDEEQQKYTIPPEELQTLFQAMIDIENME